MGGTASSSVDRRSVAAALWRPLLLLVLLCLVGALRRVDANLAGAVERHASAGLDLIPQLAVVAAALGTVAVLALLDTPDGPVRRLSFAGADRWFRAVGAPWRTESEKSVDGRLLLAWRIVRHAALLFALVRVATTVDMLLGSGGPSRLASLSGTIVTFATMALLVLYSIADVRHGADAAAAPGNPPPAATGAPAADGVGAKERRLLEARRAPWYQRRQETLARVSLVAAWLFAGLALETPYAADQVGDLLLSWTDELLPPQATFGVAAVLLLGMALQEGAITITGREPDGRVLPRPRGRTPLPVRAIAVAVTIGTLALYLLPGEFDAGSAIALIPLALVVACELAERQLPVAWRTPLPPPRVGFTAIAILPLLSLAAALTGVTVDALFLYGPDRDYLLRALPPALLLVASVVVVVVSTCRIEPGEVREDDLRAWQVGIPSIVAIALAWWLVSPRIAGAIALAGALVYGWRFRSRGHLWALNLSLAAGAAFVVATILRPLPTGYGIGTVGAIGIGGAALFAILQYLVRLFDLVPITGVLHLRQPFYRVPIVSILVAWVVLATLAAPDTAHDVRLADAAPANPSGASVDQALAAWWAAQPEATGTAPAGTSVPLVLVAAEGGGLRAAYWTGGVLDVLAYGADPARRLVSVPSADGGCPPGPAAAGRTFVLSGASGGSVGAYAYARELEQHRRCLAPGWYARWFARDLLGPTVGWGIVHDLFANAFHQRPGVGGRCRFAASSWLCDVLRDRAAILEQALDPPGEPAGPGIRSAAFTTPTGGPQLIFNTSADDLSERVTVSSLALPDRPYVAEPALDDHCTAGDIPLRSAAVLSARFPIITSAGRIACAHRSVVDGGYLDNSGIASIAELLPELATAVGRLNLEHAATPGVPPIRIVIVEVSNGPRGPDSPLRGTRFPNQVAPRFGLLGLLALPSYPTEVGRDELGAAARAACAAGVDTALITVRPPLEPGWQASVGWRLSRAARAGLEDALIDRTDASGHPATSTPGSAVALLSPTFAAGTCPWQPSHG